MGLIFLLSVGALLYLKKNKDKVENYKRYRNIAIGALVLSLAMAEGEADVNLSVTTDKGSGEAETKEESEGHTKAEKEEAIKEDDNKEKESKPKSKEEEILDYLDTLPEVSVNSYSPDEEGRGVDFDVRFGKLLEYNITKDIDENIGVFKAKIKPSYNNKATINQNAFNVEHLIKKQGASAFDKIVYWAVAEMVDGSEGKVISFNLNKEQIELIKEGRIPGNQILQYADNVWILPSLLEQTHLR